MIAPTTARASGEPRRFEAAIDPSDRILMLGMVSHVERTLFARCDCPPSGAGRLFVVELREGSAAAVALLELLFAQPYRAAAYARVWAYPRRAADVAGLMAGTERHRLEVPVQLGELARLGLLAEDADGRLHVREMARGGEA